MNKIKILFLLFTIVSCNKVNNDATFENIKIATKEKVKRYSNILAGKVILDQKNKIKQK
jgi:hypothetical protein